MTSSTAELNVLTGMTRSTSDLNDLATLSGLETLTNKTLTAPQINGGVIDAATANDTAFTGTQTGFVGDITGDVIGNVTGNLTGNADTVTTNANLTGPITSVGNATNIEPDTVNFGAEIATSGVTGFWNVTTGGQIVPEGVYAVYSAGDGISVEAFINTSWRTVSPEIDDFAGNAEVVTGDNVNTRLIAATVTRTVYWTKLY